MKLFNGGFALILILLSCQLIQITRAEAAFITEADYDQILNNIRVPLDETQDIDDVKKITQERSSGDCAKARKEATWSAEAFFGPDSGRLLTPSEFLIVEHFLNYLSTEVDRPVHFLKEKTNRIRPYLRQPKIIAPCAGKLAARGTSFPSGHAAAAYIQGLALSELFPNRKEKIMHRAEDIGRGRMILGVHFPSDVRAGYEIAERTFHLLKLNHEFMEEFEKIRTKILSLPHRL